LLPRVRELPGREIRANHLELCLVCQTRVRKWRHKWTGKTDWGLAATGVATYHLRVKGGTGLRRVGRMFGDASSWTVSRARQAAEQRRQRAEQRRTRKAAEVTVRPEQESDAPLTQAPKKEAVAQKKREKKTRGREKLPPLVVLEKMPGMPPAEVLADEVEARGGALVIVDSVHEVFSDRDFPSVHTIVLARPHPFGELPMVYETIRRQAPGRALFAIVAIPSTGPMARDLEEDNFVIASPLTVQSWSSALETAGWKLPG
jgi:hypothetical protein